MEILILIGYFILNYISELYLILINKSLNPIHYLIADLLFNLLNIPYEMLI